MLYGYNTEYTTKHSAKWYGEDINSTGKSVDNESIVCQV